jgi:segregation and condensation protein A
LLADSPINLSEDLDIQIDQLFSGPFDLLLHLIRKHELDLKEIPLGFLAEKYLQALQKLENLNIDIATDFLVIAATLVQWKSQAFLPIPKEEELSEEDLSSIIARRLLLFRKFRKGAAWLHAQTTMETTIWRRGGVIIIPEDESNKLEKFPLNELAELLKTILPKEGRRRFGRSSMVTEFSLHDRISEILELLDSKNKIDFRELFPKGEPQEISSYIISFLALLEISRIGIATLVQNEMGGNIYIFKHSDDYDGKDQHATTVNG